MVCARTSGCPWSNSDRIVEFARRHQWTAGLGRGDALHLVERLALVVMLPPTSRATIALSVSFSASSRKRTIASFDQVPIGLLPVEARQRSELRQDLRDRTGVPWLRIEAGQSQRRLRRPSPQRSPVRRGH